MTLSFNLSEDQGSPKICVCFRWVPAVVSRSAQAQADKLRIFTPPDEYFQKTPEGNCSEYLVIQPF